MLLIAFILLYMLFGQPIDSNSKMFGLGLILGVEDILLYGVLKNFIRDLRSSREARAMERAWYIDRDLAFERKIKSRRELGNEIKGHPKYCTITDNRKRWESRYKRYTDFTTSVVSVPASS